MAKGVGKTREPKLTGRVVKPTILIVCEGEKTETNYFNALINDLKASNIIVDGKGYNTMSLIDYGKKLAKEKEVKILWCVFDKDDFKDEQFNAAVSCHKTKHKTKKDELESNIAYSNGCFELWYLLHFEYLNTGIPRTDYQSKIEKHIQKIEKNFKYAKNSNVMFDLLKDKLDVAVKNAKRLLLAYKEQHTPADRNPSTTIHLLVEELVKYRSK